MILHDDGTQSLDDPEFADLDERSLSGWMMAVRRWCGCLFECDLKVVGSCQRCQVNDTKRRSTFCREHRDEIPTAFGLSFRPTIVDVKDTLVEVSGTDVTCTPVSLA